MSIADVFFQFPATLLIMSQVDLIAFVRNLLACHDFSGIDLLKGTIPMKKKTGRMGLE
jgi:hypothetical protein